MRRQGPDPVKGPASAAETASLAPLEPTGGSAGFVRRIAPQGRSVREGRIRAIGMQAPGLSPPSARLALGSSAAEQGKIPERTFPAGAGLRQAAHPARRSGFEAEPPHLPIRPPCDRRPPRHPLTACTVPLPSSGGLCTCGPRSSALTSHTVILQKRHAGDNAARGCYARFLCIRARKLHSSSPAFSTAALAPQHQS